VDLVPIQEIVSVLAYHVVNSETDGGIQLKKIFITARAYHQIGLEVRRYSNLETGGIIMGHTTKNSVIITNATGPGPYAIHTRKSLRLDEGFCRPYPQNSSIFAKICLIASLDEKGLSKTQRNQRFSR
jgi:hypothetical protein